MFCCPNRGTLCDCTCEDCPRLERKILAGLKAEAEKRGIPLPPNIAHIVSELAKITCQLREDYDRTVLTTSKI